MKKINHRTQLGFTLIEVLIALMILAIALAAVIKVTQDSIRDTIRVQDRITAQWVGLNVISRMQVGLIPPPTPDADAEAERRLLNKNWRWTAKVLKAAGDYYESVEVNVYRQGSQARIVRLVGFLRLGQEKTEATSNEKP